MTRHVLGMGDLTAAETLSVLDLADRERAEPVLAGRGAALIFEHPSARTRNAAEMSVASLGGHPVTIRGEEIGFDVRETTEDVARTLACFHALIGARVARHVTLVRMADALDAAHVAVPVVNLLSDVEHPTQALADLLTIRQHFGDLAGRSVAFIGDANNVCRSLALGCAAVGATIRVASPAGYELSPDDAARIGAAGGALLQCRDPADAARDADVLYTDVWVSMGEEDDGARKRADFDGYTVDERLLGLASPDAVVLHCLPAHRGEEVSASVIDGPRSLVWRQAENRMHALRGLLLLLFGADQRSVGAGTDT